MVPPEAAANTYKSRVLVIDDEPDIRELLSVTLTRMDLDCTAAESVQQARNLLSKQRFDLCLTDMRLPDGNGIDLVRHTQKRHPEMPVAVITAYGNVDSAVEALKAGAFDFVSKPVNLDDLRQLVTSAIKVARQTPSNRRLNSPKLLTRTGVCRGPRSDRPTNAAVVSGVTSMG